MSETTAPTVEVPLNPPELEPPPPELPLAVRAR